MSLVSLIRPCSTQCNLSCSYCYHRYKHRQSERFLDINIFKKYAENLLKISTEEAKLIWHGGEPLLAGISFFKKAMSVLNAAEKNNPGKKFVNYLQTNGTLINDDWISFFKEFEFYVGISLDGPRLVQELYRKNSFSKVMKSLESMQKSGLNPSVIAVITKANVNIPEDLYLFFKKHGINFSINPCVEFDYKANKEETFSISPMEFSKFCIDLFDIWSNDSDNSIGVGFLQDIINGFLQGESSICMLNGKCREYLTLEYDGSIYPCEDFQNKNVFLGNVRENSLEEILSGDSYKALFGAIDESNTGCLQCRWFNICKGGCPYLRINNLFGEKLLCEASKNIFEFIGNKLNEMLDNILEKNLITV